MNTNQKPKSDLQQARSFHIQTSWRLSVYKSISPAGLLEGSDVILFLFSFLATVSFACTVHAHKGRWVNICRDDYFINKEEELVWLTRASGRESDHNGLAFRLLQKASKGWNLAIEVQIPLRQTGMVTLVLLAHFSPHTPPKSHRNEARQLPVLFPLRPNRPKF